MVVRSNIQLGLIGLVVFIVHTYITQYKKISFNLFVASYIFRKQIPEWEKAIKIQSTVQIEVYYILTNERGGWFMDSRK